MLKHLNEDLKHIIANFYTDFVRSVTKLLPYSFKYMESFIVFNLLHNNNYSIPLKQDDAPTIVKDHNNTDHTYNHNGHIKNNLHNNHFYYDNYEDQHLSFYNNNLINQQTIFYFFHTNDICRLKRFVLEGRNFYEILYLLSTIANLILFKKVKIDLSFLEYTILYAVAFQKKTPKEISSST